MSLLPWLLDPMSEIRVIDGDLEGLARAADINVTDLVMMARTVAEHSNSQRERAREI